MGPRGTGRALLSSIRWKAALAAGCAKGTVGDGAVASTAVMGEGSIGRGTPRRSVENDSSYSFRANGNP